ncbi:MAG: polyprenol monophosphomannose synthase [candidate division WOR-3 bacterium]|nr:polyprenol monophosphomannose synthase [candidate division WOR-3 bacterium]MDH7519290.1 polyprenol monophosphomannose synthase [bacterium]
MPRGLVIMPTYNEAENIEKIIPVVLDQLPEIEVLVIDDGSPDGTGDIVARMAETNPRVHLIRREKKLGLGTAYVLGFRYALEHNYDYCFEMDADFSHPPEKIPEMVAWLKDYDLVIGSRYSDGISIVNWPMKRLLLSYFACLYARKVTGCPVRDLTAGFKAYRCDMLRRIDLNQLREDGYGFQIEIDFLIWRKGGRIKEIPIVFTERRAGVSKMSKRIIWRAFILVLRLRLQRLLGKV